MKLPVPISLLLAGTLCYYSLSALGWAVALHTDPWNASDFADEQAKAQGFDWPQEMFRDLGRGNYQARYRSPDYKQSVTVDVRKGPGGWELVSLTERALSCPTDEQASR